MKLKRCLSLVRASILDSLQFRGALILTFVGNLFYLLLIYNLWKAIYESSGTDIINGMTFSDTMIYLVFASALFNFMEMWIVWGIGRNIQSGQIVLDLLKPVEFRSFVFFGGCGEPIIKFVTTFLPTAIIVYFLSGRAIPLGKNILFFAISVILGMIINFYINFFVATICMHTQSIWGINIMKEVIVGLLSGASVPLAFFPETFKNIVMYLPFQAVCNSPLRLLLHNEYEISEVLIILGTQVFWVLFLMITTEIFFKFSLKKITVNGG